MKELPKRHPLVANLSYQIIEVYIFWTFEELTIGTMPLQCLRTVFLFICSFISFKCYLRMLSTENEVVRRVCVEWMDTERGWTDTYGIKSKKMEKNL
jgi:hypothetical protein